VDIGDNDTNVSVPVCLKQGDYYSNYPEDRSIHHDEFINEHNGVSYNYMRRGCELRVSFYKEAPNYQWAGYRNFGNKQTGWHGKDKWNSDTCAVLCNSEQQFDSDRPNNYVSNQGVTFTKSHRCNPKSTCNQFDTYDQYNGFYYDYGCKDGGNGYYHEETCRD
jgi:hypothetical protein